MATSESLWPSVGRGRLSKASQGVASRLILETKDGQVGQHPKVREFIKRLIQIAVAIDKPAAA